MNRLGWCLLFSEVFTAASWAGQISVLELGRGAVADTNELLGCDSILHSLEQWTFHLTEKACSRVRCLNKKRHPILHLAP